MTLPRSVADVLADHVVFEIECIDRMYCNVYVPQLQHAGWFAGLHPASARFADRLDRPAGEDHRRVQRGDAPLRPRPRCAVGGLRQGPAQGRRDARAPGSVRPPGGGVVHRPGAGEDVVVPHRASPRRQRRLLSVDRARDGCGQPVLRLRRRPGLRAVLPQVLLLLSLQRQAVPQRPRVGQTPSREGRDRVHTALDNGFASCATRPRSRRSATGWAPTQIDALLRKWLAVLPHPFSPADREAGYRYDISMLQAEFSLTQCWTGRCPGGCSSNTSSATTSTPDVPTRSA